MLPRSAKSKNRAKNLGVASHKTVDETKNYYDKVIRYLIYGNVLKNNTYPLTRERRADVTGVGYRDLRERNKGRCCRARKHRRR